MQAEMIDSEANGIQEITNNAQTGGERRRPSREELISRLPIPGPGSQPVYSSEDMIAALHDNKGGMYLAAKQLGCTYQCIWDRSKVDPEVMQVIKHYRGSLVDKAEGKLLEGVERGDAWAVQFTLKTIGKKRGYVERVETRNRTQLKGAMVTFLAPQQLTGLLGADPAESLPDTPALPEHDPTAQTRS